RSTYENSDPVRSSPPRIQIPSKSLARWNHVSSPKASGFFSSLLEQFQQKSAAVLRPELPKNKETAPSLDERWRQLKRNQFIRRLS
ncbi:MULTISPECIES: hypothetical protein, partial [unclassified Rhizobium]|uniref:hypothetical protein n=1 Tax=unclassified Rhizobium TaxID=2613769 RepID=UPI001C837C98